MRRTQNRKQTTRQKRRTHKRKRAILTGGALMPKFGADTIRKFLDLPAVKIQLQTVSELPNETGVANVKTVYDTTLKTEELYDIITPSDGSAVKVWSHGSGPSASASVTAGISGKHVYITGGPNKAPQVVGVVIRSST
jgi:hypothetical protein